MERAIKINNWSGGLSDSEVTGVPGSFYEGVGLDIHSRPNILSVNQALKKESGATVTNLCYCAVACSNGKSYWFGAGGAIYERASNGTWAKRYDSVEYPVNGAHEYNGYIYWASPTKLHRIKITNIPSGTWTTEPDDNWQTLDRASWHPMVVQGLYLLIGNCRKIATVDDSAVFTAAGTPDVTLDTLVADYEITCMEKYDNDVLVGTKSTNSYTYAAVFRWDIYSPSYVSVSSLSEYSVNALFPGDDTVYSQAGGEGNIYVYNGERFTLRKRMRGDFSVAANSMKMNPYSYTTYRSMPMLGISDSVANPVLQGIYSLGRYNNNYPLALNLEYPISADKTSYVEIGACLTIGKNILVSWIWDNKVIASQVGVDIIDWENKYTGAYLKTLYIYGADRERNKDFQLYTIGYTSLPTSTALTLKGYVNGGSEETITLSNISKDMKYHAESTKNGGYMQFKIGFTVSGNTAPSVDLFRVQVDEKDKI